MARAFFSLLLALVLASCATAPGEERVELTVVVEGEGRVSSEPAGIADCTDSCTADFPPGTTVILRAVPSVGHGLTGWSEATCGEALSCEVTLEAATTVTARFAAIYRLSVERAGEGNGRVTSADEKIDCPEDCEGSYYDGSQPSLSAQPAPGSVFAGWSGACEGAGACTPTVSSDVTVTATFEPEDPEDAPPRLSGLSDQMLVQNTSGPRTLELSFTVSDDGDPAELSVSATSDTSALTGEPEVACDDAGACTLTLNVQRESEASARVTVKVSDPGGSEDEARVEVTVTPRLVSSAADTGTGTLRDSIAAAEAGDVLAFDASGAFAGPQTVTLASGQLTLEKSLTIVGPGRDLLTLEGGGSQRLFTVEPGAEVSLSGVTLQNGVGQDGGGSVLSNSVGGAVVNRGNLTLASVTLAGNSAERGGAIYNAAGAMLTLEGASVMDNEASFSGGALFNDSQDYPGQLATATMTLKNSSFTGNRAGSYGGVLYTYQSGSVVVVENSTFEDNQAQSSSVIGNGSLGGEDCPEVEQSCVSEAGTLTVSGATLRNNRSIQVDIEDGNGALSNFGVLTLSDSSFEGNEAPAGAALYNQYLSEATLSGVSFSGNTAESNAGAIYNEGELTFAQNVTVSSNLAGLNGGGIFNNGHVGTLVIPGGKGNLISNNLAENRGGGLYNGYMTGSDHGVEQVDPTTFENNEPGDIDLGPDYLAHPIRLVG